MSAETYGIKKKYYFWLDWIRLLSALAVVVCHVRGAVLPEYGELPPEQHNFIVFLFYTMTRMGADAVVCFFTLSGFLVGGKVLDGVLYHSFDFKRFMIGRFVRILPPLVFGLMLWVVLGSFYCTIQGPAISLPLFVGNALGVNGILCQTAVGPYWALPYETWFYVIVGCLGGVVLIKKAGWRAIAVLGLLVGVWMYWHLEFSRLAIFTAGMLAHWLSGRFPAKRHMWVGAIIVFIMSIGVRMCASGSNAFAKLIPISCSSSLVLLGLSVAFLLWAISTRVPKNKLVSGFEAMGPRCAISTYSIFLTHMQFVWFLTYLGMRRYTYLGVQSVLVFVGVSLLVIVLGHCAYWCCEKHTGRLSRRMLELIG